MGGVQGFGINGGEGEGRGIERFVTDPYRDNPPDQHCLVLVVGFGLGPFSQISSSAVMSLSNNDGSRDDLIIGGMFDIGFAGEENVYVLLWRGKLGSLGCCPSKDPLYARHAKSALGCLDRVR